MFTYRLGVAELAETKFAISPVGEASLSLWVTIAGLPGRPHLRRWREAARDGLDADGYATLAALVLRNDGSAGYLPDFITPLPVTPRPSLEGQLEAIATTDPTVVARELEGLLDKRSPALLRDFVADPETARVRIADSLGRYFEVVLAPIWANVSRVLEGDIIFRGRELALGGPARLFGGLTENLDWAPTGALTVKVPGASEATVPAAGGPVLTPSVAVTTISSWGAPQHYAPWVAYPARGSAQLMGRVTNPPSAHALRALIGAAKAELLAVLVDPASTAELSMRLRVTPSAVSQNLRVLAEAGLVDRARAGRRVLYRRTELAENLINQSAEASAPTPGLRRDH